MVCVRQSTTVDRVPSLHVDELNLLVLDVMHLQHIAYSGRGGPILKRASAHHDDRRP
jgi:hypothetical protein